ncbi:hypothetical protein [Rhodococcus sp. 1168]|uniref:hypothetical protein n=1 Tax=Rhodococcus sp. 1168 TaxID=2018041 RepID=UPI000F74BFCB|nr:hypothetical protein [Rhodococcus sp. 1168]
MNSNSKTTRRPAISVDEWRAQKSTQRETDSAVSDYARKARAIHDYSATLVERSQRFDYANLAVELATAHTAMLETAPGVSNLNDSGDVGAVTDASGDPFDVGYHYFPDATPGEPVHLVTLGDHTTPISVDQVPELIRLLLAAAAGACNHSETVRAAVV